MALTWVEYFTTNDTGTAGGDVTSSSFSVAINDIITVLFLLEDNNTNTLTFSQPTGTALSWTLIDDTGAGANSNARVAAWRAKATVAESITVSVAGNSAITYKSSLSVAVHTGANTVNPILSGSVTKGTGANDATQAILPTSPGSALWMGLADWQTAGALNPNANCTQESLHNASSYTGAIIRPTTQPRTDWTSFTIGEVSDATSEKTAWLAFEVRAVGIDFFASARNPADTGAAVTPPVSVVPPANMLEGDLCIVHVGSRSSSAFDYSNSTTGGQTWNKAGEFDSTNLAKQATFWCRFNGTWSANPAFTVSSGTTASWAEMQVFRPSNGANTWAVDQAYTGANVAAPTTPFTYTRTGVTNAQAATVTVANFVSADDNTWGSLSGAGWTTYSPLYTRIGSNASHAHAYRIGGSGATGNVSLNQATLGGDAGSTAIVSFYEIASGGPTEKIGSDAPSLSVSETQASLASSDRSDAPTLAVTEASAVTVPLATVTDTPAIAVTELSELFIAAIVAGSDAPAVAVTDAVMELFATSTRSDAPALSLTEVANLFVTVATGDAPALSVGEVSAVLGPQTEVSGSDTPALAVTETTTSLQSFSDLSDAPALALVEASNNLLRSVLADTPTISITELSELLWLFARSDSPALSVTEVASVAITVHKTASDDPAFGVVEAAEPPVNLGRWPQAGPPPSGGWGQDGPQQGAWSGAGGSQASWNAQSPVASPWSNAGPLTTNWSK